MTSTFLIFDVVTWTVNVEAPTVELIEKSYHKPMHGIARSMTQQIGEYPVMLGVNIYTFKDMPRQVIMDGITRYAQRKAAAQ
jgi:hypothetical protein